jgi:3-phenylpropionate/trans-cinnamate dioxygenase ferredoxin reductase subunit
METLNSSPNSRYKYLIVGGGMTADAAVKGIRSVDPVGDIGILSAESVAPYNRPPLSKGLWKGEPVESIWRGTAGPNVTLHLGRTAQVLKPVDKRVIDTENNSYTYEKLLIATGGSPRTLPFGSEHIIYYRTLADYKRLRELTGHGKQFAVIGGGFIGSEVTAALTTNGKEVVMIFPGADIGDRIYPHDLAKFLTSFYFKKGVQLLAGEKVIGLEDLNNRLVVKTESGKEILVDGVVAGIGIEPNVDLAISAKLKVEKGILVDDFLRTSHYDIYSAGDVAEFFSPALGKRMRVEHEDNANTMGHVAGRNMAGKAETYAHLPFFYSDLFELGYEAVGELDSRLETFSDWKEPNREGVIYYLRNGRVRGVLLWNVWGKVEAARQLIAEPGPLSADNLKGRIT